MPETSLSNACRKRSDVSAASRFALFMRSRMSSFSRHVTTLAAVAPRTKKPWIGGPDPRVAAVAVDRVRRDRAQDAVLEHHVADRDPEREPVLVEREHGDHHEEVEVGLDLAVPGVHEHRRRGRAGRTRPRSSARGGRARGASRPRRRARSGPPSRSRSRGSNPRKSENTGSTTTCAQRIHSIARWRASHASAGSVLPRGSVFLRLAEACARRPGPRLAAGPASDAP